MSQQQGIFILLDGIAGSGKSTLLNALKASVRESGKSIFDMQEWNQAHTAPPTFEEIKDHDIYFIFEPTKTWIGSAIRGEISFHPERYSARTQAEAFSLDRMIQYERIVIPALRAGKIIIQDRGVTTSLVYQSTLDPNLTMHDIAKLPGNRLALQYAPQHLVLTYLDPEIAQTRRNTRNDASKGMYEETELLRRAQETFHGEAFCDFMKAHGTAIHVVDTSHDIDSSIQQFQSLIYPLIQI